MMIKIDLEKAFDKIEWSFVGFTLTSLKFPQELINVIMSRVTITSTSILINGSNMKFLDPQGELDRETSYHLTYL